MLFWPNFNRNVDAILRKTLSLGFTGDLITIASGLKWMGEYNCEREILRYAEANGFLNGNRTALFRLNQLNRRR